VDASLLPGTAHNEKETVLFFAERYSAMPNDAKLGLVLGISLVVVIGMVFFRVDPPAHGVQAPPTTSVNSPLSVPTQETPLDPFPN
jgi:hypothetical protein